MDGRWYVYVLRCADDSLYVGTSADLEARVACHNNGKGAKYTRSRRPVRLVYRETCDSRNTALAREREIKGWRREKKEKLIAGFLRRTE